MIATIYKGLSNKPDVVELPCGVAIKDALPNEDTERAVIFVNNKPVDENYIIQKGDNVFIRIAPGALTTALTALFVTAVVVVVGVAVGTELYKMKLAAETAAAELEKLKNSTNTDIDNRPFLRGGSNTAATSQTQPYICGRHLFTPYTLSDAFYEIEGTDGETQYANIILEGGFNKQVIDTVGTDDINILTLDDTEPQEGAFNTNAGTVFADGVIEIAQDGELLDAIPNLNYKVVSTTCNEEVPKTQEIEAGEAEDYIFTLDSYARDVTVCMSFTSGLYAYDSDGDKIVTAVTITPQYSLDGGETWIDFTFYNSYEESYTNHFARAISTKELRYTAYKEFSLSDYETLYNNGQSAIYCRLRSSGNTDSQICNTAYILYYQSVCFDPNTSSSPAGILDDEGEAGLSKCLVLNDRERAKSTMIGVRLKATSSNEDKLSKIFIISTGIARTWDGEKWSDEKVKTRNPAAWALEILTSDTHALSKFSDDEIDLESFGEFYEYCEENEFYFDYVISQKTKKDTVLGYITDSCGAVLYTDITGRKAVAIDRPQENAIAIYNPQNIISIENSREFARRTDCVRVTYVNSDDDLFEEDTYSVMREIDGEPVELDENTVITDLTTSGITTYEHVVKYARRMMAIEILRPKNTTIEVGNEGIFFTPYAKVLLQDDSLKIGTGSAVVEGVAWAGGVAQTLYLKNPVTIEEGKSYGVIIECFADEGTKRLSLKVAGITGQTSELEILTELKSTDEAIPEGGEVLSFGELDDEGEFTKITTPYVIASITRSDNGFSLELVNYDEAIYDTGTIPDYVSNITQKPASSSAEIPDDFISRDELYGAITNVTGTLTDGSNGNVGSPDTPTDVAGIAEKDGIDLSCKNGGLGLRNNLTLITWEITKADGSTVEVTSSTTEGYYTFDREADGYPEAEDLLQWRVRVKAQNAYNEESEWSDSVIVSTDTYGTWVVSQPDVSITVSGRSITLRMSQPTLASGRDRYGTFLYRIQIQKPSESDEWYKPAQSLDPYASEDNWNEGEGFVTVESVYTQTMPLTGQTLQEVEVEGETVWQSSPEATLYRFKIEAYSEAGEAEAKEVNATALGTSIQDIVQGSVTHDKISTPSLSAIAANMGYITSGAFSGSELNYWALSTIQGLSSQGIADVYEGAFRVGGTDEYLIVEPQVTNGVVTGYTMRFKAGAFEITTETTSINGEIIVQENETSLNRTRITPKGVYFEHRASSESENWETVSRFRVDGIKTKSVFSDENLVISNLALAKRRALGHDIGKPYLSEAARVWHFDTDFLDQNQEEGLTITGEAELVDDESYPDSDLDFTPAILAVAPYAEEAKAAFGQFRAAIELEASNTVTVDFWLQYIWNEDQVLFDIGSDTDKIRLVCANDECYYNDYQEGKDEAPFNAEMLGAGDVVVWNEPVEASSAIEHYGSGSATESETLESLGVEFESNEWLHVAIVFSESNLSVFLNEAQVSFDRFSQAAQAISVVLNDLAGSFFLDELYIDTGASETFEEFIEATEDRLPWGALDHSKKNFVLDADELTTNIFDTDLFKEKVREIIAEGNNGDN